MPYSFLEHTADIRIHVAGKTLDELFRDALLGMVAVMDPAKPQKPEQIKRAIALRAGDATSLLVDFLSEALAYIHAAREAYTDVSFQALTERELKAELAGYVAEAFGEDIKAATYHEAEVTKNAKGDWETNIVFDI